MTIEPRAAWRPTLTQLIFVGLFLGIAAGYAVHQHDTSLAIVFKPFSAIFLRMIKMIIAPLIFCSLVSGIAGAGDARSVGRIGLKSMIFFEVVTTLALIVGLLAVNWTMPGVGVNLPLPDGAAASLAKPQTWDQILVHVFPDSIIKAMAEGDVLQIVVFSVFFAMGLNLLGDRGRPLVQWCEVVTEVMFRVTAIVMRYAPVGVGAAMAYTVGHSGFGVLWNLGQLILTLYGALVIFGITVLLPSALLFGVPVRAFLKAIKEPSILAFSTTSSESALPSAMTALERLGVPRHIISMVMPLGYSFNLAGTTLYLSLATVFVSQAANMPLTTTQQITMLLTLMLTSKGVAAVPRASLVILAGTLATYGLPLEGITLILGVDELMDMARTTINVIGNCLATCVVARWEGAWDGRPSDSVRP